MRKEFSYENLVVNSNEMSFSKIVELAEVFDKKGKFFAPSVPTKVYFDKSSEMSYCSIPFSIKIINISECEVVFETKYKLPLYSSYSLDEPAKFWMTIIPHKKVTIFPSTSYRALIHGQSREDKNELRKFIIAKSKK